MNLSGIKPPAGQKHNSRRIGRGMGSGRSKTAGRGQKGQRSISGFSLMRGFENIFAKEYAIVNVGRLDALEGAEFDPAKLVELGVTKKPGDGLRVLGAGELKRAITVKAHFFSASAKQKIEAAGGTAELIAPAVKA
jgi:large subunit ribosomal protein L15